MPNERTESATMVRDAIAAEVRAELARQRKKQREVAEILGLPQPSITLRLNGTTPFRAEELVLLANALDIPAERFLQPPAPAPVSAA